MGHRGLLPFRFIVSTPKIIHIMTLMQQYAVLLQRVRAGGIAIRVMTFAPREDQQTLLRVQDTRTGRVSVSIQVSGQG
jgi:hypothetical protein